MVAWVAQLVGESGSLWIHDCQYCLLAKRVATDYALSFPRELAIL